MTAMPQRSKLTGASPTILLVGLALLIAVSAWILWPDSASPIGDGDLNATNLANSDQVGLAAPDSQPVRGPVRRDSPLIQATVTVLLAIPAWATAPETVKIELIPQGSNPAQKRHLWTKAGSRHVRFDDVQFGSWLVRAAPRGFQATEVPLSVSEIAAAPRQVLNLVPSRSIRGRVIDATGAPVAKVPVSARPVEAIPGFTVTRATATTDEEGRYRLSGLPEGKYWVFAGELRSAIGPMVETQLIGDEAWADLTIPALGSATITAIDELTQLPIEGIRVQAMRVDPDGQPGHTTFKQTESDGTASFPALPPGLYDFTFLKPSIYKRTSRRFEVTANQDAPLRVTVLPI
jgi:hypothetical protein